MNMLGNIPYQKFCFYHLPTRERAGIKLEDAGTSPSYLLFQTLLPLFWTLICMIWIKLTWTDTVFSRIAMVLFLCRNKSSRNDLKLHGTNFWKILKILEERSTSGGPHPVHEGGGAPYPPGHAPCLVDSSYVSWRPLQVLWITFVPKITLSKVSFRLDSVWYSFSSKF